MARKPIVSGLTCSTVKIPVPDMYLTAVPWYAMMSHHDTTRSRYINAYIFQLSSRMAFPFNITVGFRFSIPRTVDFLSIDIHIVPMDPRKIS
jgi:riboflavin transporter FmnP